MCQAEFTTLCAQLLILSVAPVFKVLNDPADPQATLHAHGFIALMENLSLIAVMATLAIGVTAQVNK
jgi:hypothetical protein